MFAPLAPTYDRYASLLSYGQDPRWRRFLVSRIEAGPGDRILDVATGTGAVALELLRQKGCTVVGVDQSAEMLAEASRRSGGEIELVEASAQSLPFDDGEFDGLTFTYLLRYVDDPPAVLRELARVVRPGGTIAGLEFGLPAGRLARLSGSCTSARACPLPALRSAAAGTRPARSSARRSAATTRRGRSTGSSKPGATRASAASRHAGSLWAEGW